MYDKTLVNGIENFEEKIEAYASLIVNAGIRFQKGWALGIECPITCPDIARACTKEAYKQGARDVSVYWYDPYTDRERYQNSEMKYLDMIDVWPDFARKKYNNKNMAFIIFLCDNVDFLSNLSLERQLKAGKKRSVNFASFKRGLEIPYTICAASNREWAHKIFPDLPVDEAYIKLWNLLFEVARIDGKSDPVQTWMDHCKEMDVHAQKLQDFHFKSLHFTSGIGTDVTFNLPKNHKWIATAENTSSGGNKFSANMPTEEVFTIPEKDGVNGTIVSNTVLISSAGEIKNPKFVVENGKIIDFSSETGQDSFEALMDSDKNGRYFGEVAIVPYDTPISRQGIAYYNSLFDENAGCHTAIGNAYSKCLEGGLQMTNEELEAANINVCSFHNDCIFGTSDMKIVGTTYDGENITIFENGAFVI